MASVSRASAPLLCAALAITVFGVGAAGAQAGAPTDSVASNQAGARSVAATAERFAAAINAADGLALSALIDVDALGARVLRNLELDPLDRARYLASLRMQHAMLGRSVAAQMAAQNATATLLRSSPSVDGGEFLVRITTRDARDNLAHGYLQVEVDPHGRIVDWYDHSLALSMSGQLAFSAAGLLTTTQVAQLLFGDVDEGLATSRSLQQLATLLSTGALAPAHSVLMTMPQSMRTRREFATLRVTLARSVGMDAYREALAELALRHGDADDLQLILIDHHLLDGQPERALQAVERAARVIGNDEVMEANRCHALLELGRKADALAACDRAIARAPAFETPRWTRVRLALKTEDAPLAIESLNGVEQAQGHRLESGWMKSNPVYAWLVTQPEFAAWAAERDGSAPEETP